MADLDELALGLPQTTKELSDDGRPSYLVHGKRFCLQRRRRPDAVDPETAERLDDGDDVRIGSVPLTFRAFPAAAPTETAM